MRKTIPLSALRATLPHQEWGSGITKFKVRCQYPSQPPKYIMVRPAGRATALRNLYHRKTH
jgi:hypothetical protein